MASTNILFTKEEEKIITKYKIKFKMNKLDTIKEIIKEFDNIYKGAPKAD